MTLWSCVWSLHDFFSCFVLFVILLYLAHSVILITSLGKMSLLFLFISFVACVMSFMACLFFLMMSLVGYSVIYSGSSWTFLYFLNSCSISSADHTKEVFLLHLLLFICSLAHYRLKHFAPSPVPPYIGAASVAQLDHRPTGDNPRRGRQHSFVEIDHELFSTVILSLPLIQEGQLSVSGERMCTVLVNRLEDLACPGNVWLGKLTALDMTPLG